MSSHKQGENQNGRIKFFHSIRFKLTFMLVAVMGSWMLITWFASHLFLGHFYAGKIRQVLVDSYNSINKMVGDSENVYEILSENFYTSSNIDVVIGRFVDENTVVPDYSTSSDGSMGQVSMVKLFSLAAKAQASEGSDWRFNKAGSDKGSYIIQKTHDNTTDSDYLNLIGTLDNKRVIVIQTPLESIRNSASISNTFLAYVGTIVTLLGCVIMLFISNSYAKPIQQMADIARRMSNLDFDAKVSHFSDDEVGVLGHSMNNMAEKLEVSISELKTANNELRKDIDRKTQIDEMRKEFLSHVSHELKTPIALIQGYAEGLKDNILDDEESKEFYCDVIIDEADKMNQMVKQLLTLNELEFGNNQIQIEHFNISEMIRNVIQQSDILIKQGTAKVEVELPEPLYVWADEFKLEQVFTNYFTNALHYVRDNGIVRIYQEAFDNAVRIYVYNDGEHISEDDIDKLFIKFYKADKARSREYGGNGIGLSIVAATMDAHGKAYGVENVDGGVRFYFDVDIDNNI